MEKRDVCETGTTTFYWPKYCQAILSIKNILVWVIFASFQLWKGYVDDPRNTDNSWMETMAVNFHDESGDVFSKFKLHAGDDAGDVRWMAIRKDLKLYANHRDIIEKAARFHFAFW